jgi:orotidine-5'-phosphate decarboxylase
MKKNYNPVIFAIDLNDFDCVIQILKDVHDLIGLVKFGLEFFYSFGPQGLKKINDLFPNLKIFLDLKFYDIPNTVSRALMAFKDLKNIEMMTFHAQGGTEMFLRAKKVLQEILPKTKILAVTKLTSFKINESEILELGRDAILNSNADALVCPAEISGFLKNEIKKEFFIVSPGIRFTDNFFKKDDQKVVMKPDQALQSGADYIVIGRPIMESENKREFILKNLGDMIF